MRKFLSCVSLFFKRLFGKKYYAQKCGHLTALKGYIVVFGEKVLISLKPKEGKVDYCLECIGKMAIRCAWCGRSIMVGEPITLYTPTNPNFKIPEYAVVYQEEPLQLVGCLRWDCADSGIERAGFWVAPGRVLRVLSPAEKLLAAVEKGEEEPVVKVDNLFDINEALK